MIHMFDGMDMHQGSGYGGTDPRKDYWIPCAEAGAWCAPYRDRLSASLVSADLPYLYGGGAGAGFILDLDADGIFCSYDRDGGTLDKTCEIDDDFLDVKKRDSKGVDRCLPGCSIGSDKLNDEQGGRWCATTAGWKFDCAFRSTDTAAMLRQHIAFRSSYNEVVVDVAKFVSGLPHSIAAVFFTKSATPSMRAQAIEVHREFHATFGPSLAQGDVPLVVLDVASRQSAVREWRED